MAKNRSGPAYSWKDTIIALIIAGAIFGGAAILMAVIHTLVWQVWP
jgi:hypothetical protein